MIIHTRYNLPPRPTVRCGDGLTRQEFKAESDINTLLVRYNNTGSYYPGIPPSTRPPSFADVSEVPDYQASMDAVIRAQELFDALPSRVRDRFGNDPARLMQFVLDPKNRDEAVSLGILKAADSSTDASAIVSPAVKNDGSASKTEA